MGGHAIKTARLSPRIAKDEGPTWKNERKNTIQRYQSSSIAPRALIGNDLSVTTNRETMKRPVGNWVLAIVSDHHPSNLLILMAMKDRIDRGGPESGRFGVTEKSEFQAPSTK